MILHPDLSLLAASAAIVLLMMILINSAPAFAGQWHTLPENQRRLLRTMDNAKSELFPLFATTYGPAQAKRWWIRRRIFFVVCAELRGWRSTSEWLVSHSLLSKSTSSGGTVTPDCVLGFECIPTKSPKSLHTS
jgi:hypothetical protein